jgi:hypothetical protein
MTDARTKKTPGPDHPITVAPFTSHVVFYVDRVSMTTSPGESTVR